MRTSASGILFPSVFFVTLVFPMFLLGQTAPPPPFKQPVAPSDVTVPAEPSSEIRQAHLINSSLGWVLQGERLLWTDTAGRTFQDITPPLAKDQSMDTIHFHDGLNGWVAILGPTQDSGSSVIIAATSNGGKSWLLTPIAPHDDNFLDSFSGKVSLSFSDSEHGFALFRLIGSTASSGGFLYGTDDGGRTWKQLSVTAFGTIQFLTPYTGWLVGGILDRHIYRTSDGGVTWKELTVPLPPDIKPQNPATLLNKEPSYNFSYDDASFSNLENGTLQVDYHSGGGKDEGVHKVGTFYTLNGGDSWQWVKSTPVLLDSSSKIVRMLDHSAVAPSVTLNGNAISIESASGAHRNALPITLHANGRLLITSADFSDSWHGWLLLIGDFQGAYPRRTALVSTSDGGLTFEVLLQTYNPLKKQGAIRGGGSISDVGITSPASNFGIDSCNYESAAITNSLYGTYLVPTGWKTYGFYLTGGQTSDRANCKYPDANWIQQTACAGWNYAPIFDGLQAVCTQDYTSQKIPINDLVSAANDGVRDANTALGSLAAAGLQGTVIYLDIENYIPSFQVGGSLACSQSVKAYVNAWIHQVKSSGTAAGVYSAGRDLGSDILSLQYVPDYIWDSWQSIPVSASLSPLSGIPDLAWTHSQRSRQYELNTQPMLSTSGMAIITI